MLILVSDYRFSVFCVEVSSDVQYYTGSLLIMLIPKSYIFVHFLIENPIPKCFHHRHPNHLYITISLCFFSVFHYLDILDLIVVNVHFLVNLFDIPKICHLNLAPVEVQFGFLVLTCRDTGRSSIINMAVASS